MPRRRRLLVYALVLLALTGTTILYIQPDFMVQLGNQLWGCF